MPENRREPYSPVPKIVASTGAFVEVLVVSAIELVETVEDILASVGVHDIEEDSDSKSMGRVYEFTEVVGCTVSGTSREERCYLVAKR